MAADFFIVLPFSSSVAVTVNKVRRTFELIHSIDKRWKSAPHMFSKLKTAFWERALRWSPSAFCGNILCHTFSSIFRWRKIECISLGQHQRMCSVQPKDVFNGFHILLISASSTGRPLIKWQSEKILMHMYAVCIIYRVSASSRLDILKHTFRHQFDCNGAKRKFVVDCFHIEDAINSLLTDDSLGCSQTFDRNGINQWVSNNNAIFAEHTLSLRRD